MKLYDVITTKKKAAYIGLYLVVFSFVGFTQSQDEATIFTPIQPPKEIKLYKVSGAINSGVVNSRMSWEYETVSFVYNDTARCL
ncbi:MAG: hypothetical protein IM574_06750 [Cytophagales bacterium]|jgi:hypothetical protein|nr:hypothetical protein [Cytophagales bacterium]MCA6386460.1 hypothetical protein [Cytophagales bacterium]MCA6390030.1 hypothetical protein [Cytophagales bacterium]MCA6395163.1 hypothetical protein [Cytophagales bacterium]MCA6398190.1 hypothetical protein [Cytophagales bacterium]